MTDYLQNAAEALDLTAGRRAACEDRFTGGSIHVEGGRIYGGQLLGQAAVAGSATVEPGRPLHSIHAYFLLPGDARKPVDYRVTTLRDGRSFSSRRVDAEQGGRVIFTATCSFQQPAQGIAHQFELPAGTPGPDAPGLESLFAAPTAKDPQAEELIEVRMIPQHDWAPSVRGQLAAWVRLREHLDGGQPAQRAALAFLSDAIIQFPVLRAHGLSWDTPDTSMASLDHALWVHADAPASEWMLFVQESSYAGDGRAMTTSRMYAADGRMLANCAQEVLVRTRPVAAAPAG